MTHQDLLHLRRKLTIAASTPLLLIAALAACGTDRAPGGEQSPQAETFQEYQLSFAECMRGQGIDMADPESNTMQLDQGGDRAAFSAAAETCRTRLGEPPAPDGAPIDRMTDEELLAENLAIADCFRENGVEVPDPAPGGALDIPADTPQNVFAECAPNGVMGKTVEGGN